MSRSYEMQDIINTITSSGKAKILREYADFLIVHWLKEPHDEYSIMNVIDNPNGSKTWVSRTISKEELIESTRNPENRKKLLSQLKYRGIKMPYSQEREEAYLDKDNVVVIAENNGFIALKTHYEGWERYSLEAPMNAKNAMEDSYPWSTQITKEQAMLFINNYPLASEYYQKVRYHEHLKKSL